MLFIYCIFCVFYWRKCFYLFLCLVLLAESAWRLNQGFLQVSMTNTDLSSQTFLLMKLMLTHDLLFSKKKSLFFSSSLLSVFFCCFVKHSFFITGTLTQNEMIFKRLHLGTVSYGTDTMDEIQSHIINSYSQVSHS